MNWWIIIVLWLLVGQGVHALRRLTYLPMLNKPDNNYDEMAKYFMTPLANSKGDSVFVKPGERIVTDFFYWLYVLALWPFWVVFGFSGTFQGLVWLFDRKKPGVIKGMGAFWGWIQSQIEYFRMSKEEHTIHKRVLKKRRINVLENRKQSLLQEETKLDEENSRLIYANNREELLPGIDIGEDDFDLESELGGEKVRVEDNSS